MTLSVKRVSKTYGKSDALADVSFFLENGLYALLAPNGAGKTTLLRILATLLPPSSGTVELDGKYIGELGAKYRSLIGYLPQNLGFYPMYTPTQYLQYVAVLKGLSPDIAKSRIDKLLQSLKLGPEAGKPMKRLSGGMVQRVGIAMALLNEPKILLLDEPSAGLDPGERSSVNFMFSELAMDRIVLLSTHIISDVEFFANKIILLKDKTVYAMGDMEQHIAQVKGKVFEAQVMVGEISAMRKKYQVVAMQKQGDVQKLRFLSDQRLGEDWTPCEPTLEDLTMYIYGDKMA